MAGMFLYSNISITRQYMSFEKFGVPKANIFTIFL